MSRNKIKSTDQKSLNQDVSWSQTLSLLLKLVYELDKSYFLIMIGSALAQAANNILTIFIPRIVIDGISAGWPWQRFVQVILLIIAAKYLLKQLAAWFKRKDEVHQALLQERVPIYFAAKVMRMDYSRLEDTEVLDLKERALFPLTNYGALLQLFQHSVVLLTSVITLAGVITILINFSGLLTLVLFVLAVIGLVLLGNFLKVMQRVQQEIVPINRRYSYYSNTAVLPDFQKEFRIYDMSSLLMKKVNSYTEGIADWLHKVYVSQANAETGQSLTTALSRFATFAYAAGRVFTSSLGAQISIGEFTLIIGAAENFATSLREAVSSIMMVAQNISHLVPFASFMLMKERGVDSGELAADELDSISFENLSFSYPNSDRVILKDISFTIRRGERISIVGLNNAGKSTIVKLICRLFEPDSGRILWNGIDIREYDYDSYLEQLSCVFQDFMIFPFTIRDNVDPAGKSSESALWEILDEVSIGADVRALPEQVDTYMDKSLYEEATDMSGGQKQKLAIARSIRKGADLVILDEPTAALDPLAESEVYEHFNELVRERTAIFISHRMSSSKFCDKILLLDGGKIVAFESHENLMRGDNLYRQLFETQAANYRK
ncbi:MAG: ABC transporter ATP-binding protein [Eubacteriales bacterium]|nr:ABC transporter ATP-binding protein [Eubacteriales bacterium]